MRVSTLASEGSYRASKFLTLSLLVGTDALRELLRDLRLFRTSGVVAVGEEEMEKEEFFSAYDRYLQALKEGRDPDPVEMRVYFNDLLSVETDALYAIDVGNGRRVLKPRRPVIQMQPCTLSYSEDDQTFRSMVHGPEIIRWGIQFSYPQLFQDPSSDEIAGVHQYRNSAVFKEMQRWVRRQTQPTPFLISDRKINTPYRIDSNSMDWIDAHPDLRRENIKVAHGARC